MNKQAQEAAHTLNCNGGSRCVQRVVSTPSATNAEDFYRQLLEQIADWPRNDRGRRLAQSGLTFWDAMQAEKRRRANTKDIPHAVSESSDCSNLE